MATATTEEGDDIAGLARQIGLSAAGFHSWLSHAQVVRGYRLSTGGTVPINQLRANDVLAKGETMYIPNLVYGLWIGAFGRWGRSRVGWGWNIQYLQRLGFAVEWYNYDQHQANGNTGLDVLFDLAGFTRAKQLHGFFVWGHGGPGEMTSHHGNFSLRYDRMAEALEYKLGLVVMNVCFGMTARNHLSSRTPNSGAVALAS